MELKLKTLISNLQNKLHNVWLKCRRTRIIQLYVQFLPILT